MRKEQKLKALESLIKLIKNQEIKLISLEFDANPNIRGVFGETKDIKRNLEFGLEGIGIGEGKSKRKKEVFFSGKYIINFEDNLLKENTEETLIKTKLVYELILFFNKTELNKFLKEYEFSKIEDENLMEVFAMFFSYSGRLIIFPYVRHIIDMLMKEAGIITFPIKPLMFKK